MNPIEKLNAMQRKAKQQKDEVKKEQKEKWDNLKILHPGMTYFSEDIKKVFGLKAIAVTSDDGELLFKAGRFD
jgi:hypothetical protein